MAFFRTSDTFTLFLILVYSLTIIYGKTIDEIVFQASKLTQQFDFMLDEQGSVVKVEMDMLFTKEHWREIQKMNATDHCNHRTKRKALRGLGQRWTDRTIPYLIASHTFSYSEQRVLKSAMDDWMKYTCIKFRPAGTSDRNRIRIQNGAGCYSYVGMSGGEQEVGLARDCRVKGVVIHELGHAIGFHHEQTRPDRDDHVRIIRSNIPPSLYYNFQKYTWSVIDSYRVPYDYSSIMHYGGKAFSMNGGITIQTVNPSYQNVIGNRHGLSFRDIKLANLMYNCAGFHNCPDKKCPGEGFVGKDCKCWCPGNPYKICEATETKTTEKTTMRTTAATTAPVTAGPQECKDQHSACSQLAQTGGCSSFYSEILHAFCKKSCDVCGKEIKVECQDDHQYCAYWARQRYCNHWEYRNYMRSNCKKSCDLCADSPRYGALTQDDPHSYDVCDSSANQTTFVAWKHLLVLLCCLFFTKY